VYCEVDRNSPPKQQKIDLDQLEDEMGLLIEMATSNKLFDDPPFSLTKIEHRRLNDIAFSGDGEPTAAAEFPKAVERLAELKKKLGLTDVKLVLITNATKLQEDNVINGIDTLMANNGEIWAKLDAGTDAYCQAINRSNISLDQIIKNLEIAGKRWPIIIQTLFLEWEDHYPSSHEIHNYINKLKFLLDCGITLQGIQLHTIARPAPEIGAKPLPSAALDNISNVITKELPNTFVDVFYGPTA
jgi:wyosine [tRNA(Phe)-imidazoG37] synthetase (radical SAM superfamily)